MFGPTVRRLAEVVPKGRDAPVARLIIEKPIGHSLDSARAINVAIAEVFDERQIFRIDHYLSKETVQNFVAFRFGNGCTASDHTKIFSHRTRRVVLP